VPGWPFAARSASFTYRPEPTRTRSSTILYGSHRPAQRKSAVCRFSPSPQPVFIAIRVPASSNPSSSITVESQARFGKPGRGRKRPLSLVSTGTHLRVRSLAVLFPQHNRSRTNFRNTSLRLLESVDPTQCESRSMACSGRNSSSTASRRCS
jgi:hypothetical protein